MINLNLEQFRTLVESGGVLSVTLQGVGKDFGVKIETRRGDAVLIGTNTKKQRTFADPRKALLMLRELGVRTAKIDAESWNPEQSGINV